MKPAPFLYSSPTTVDEVLVLLAAHGDRAKLIAGGQSLLPTMNMRLARPEVLIDLRQVSGLDTIRVEGRELVLGAMTRQRDVERSPLVQQSCPLLAHALTHVAHPAIRNRGTVGGSISHADPAAELPAVMVALDARFLIAGPEGQRTVAASDFFLTYFMTVLDPAELLAEIRIPLSGPGAGSAFVEVARRHGDFALVGVAAQVWLRDGRLAMCASPTPASVRHRTVPRRLRRCWRGRRPPGRCSQMRPEWCRSRSTRNPTCMRPPSTGVSWRDRFRCRRWRVPSNEREGGCLMDSRRPLQLRVNGTAHEREVPVRLLLSDFLRHELGLTGTHVGCEHGVCGACTVLVDGAPARSCLMLAVQADGASVTTVEGLCAPDGNMTPLQQAFVECHALQCGFCTAGFLTTLTPFLAAHPSPTDEEIRVELSGNLCRCTGYESIVTAVRLAATRLKEVDA